MSDLKAGVRARTVERRELEVLHELKALCRARVVDWMDPQGDPSAPVLQPVLRRESEFDHYYAWGNNETRAERKGQACRIVAEGAKNTVLIEFEDGKKMTTSRRAVRPGRPKNDESPPQRQVRRRGGLGEGQGSFFG